MFEQLRSPEIAARMGTSQSAVARLESGTADAGEETLGEGAASVTVRCGNGGKWTVSGDALATVSTGVMGGPETAFGFTLLCG